MGVQSCFWHWLEAGRTMVDDHVRREEKEEEEIVIWDSPKWPRHPRLNFFLLLVHRVLRSDREDQDHINLAVRGLFCRIRLPVMRAWPGSSFDRSCHHRPPSFRVGGESNIVSAPER